MAMHILATNIGMGPTGRMDFLSVSNEPEPDQRIGQSAGGGRGFPLILRRFSRNVSSFCVPCNIRFPLDSAGGEGYTHLSKSASSTATGICKKGI
jgi:hypothetical protein